MQKYEINSGYQNRFANFSQTSASYIAVLFNHFKILKGL